MQEKSDIALSELICASDSKEEPFVFGPDILEKALEPVFLWGQSSKPRTRKSFIASTFEVYRLFHELLSAHEFDYETDFTVQPTMEVIVALLTGNSQCETPQIQ